MYKSTFFLILFMYLYNLSEGVPTTDKPIVSCFSKVPNQKEIIQIDLNQNTTYNATIKMPDGITVLNIIDQSSNAYLDLLIHDAQGYHIGRFHYPNLTMESIKLLCNEHPSFLNNIEFDTPVNSLDRQANKISLVGKSNAIDIVTFDMISNSIGRINTDVRSESNTLPIATVTHQNQIVSFFYNEDDKYPYLLFADTSNNVTSIYKIQGGKKYKSDEKSTNYIPLFINGDLFIVTVESNNDVSIFSVELQTNTHTVNLRNLYTAKNSYSGGEAVVVSKDQESIVLIGSTFKYNNDNSESESDNDNDNDHNNHNNNNSDRDSDSDEDNGHGNNTEARLQYTIYNIATKKVTTLIFKNQINFNLSNYVACTSQ